MNALTVPQSTAMTMTSKEMADLTEKRHDNVKRLIETLANQEVISLPQIEEVKVQRERREEVVSVYRIGKRDSYIIVAQLSPEFTARLVDRWQELEDQARNPVAALSRVDLLKLALDSEEKRLALEQRVGELAPKAAALDLISASDEALTITQAAKELSVKREKLTNWMHANGWIYRQNSAWVAYQQHIQNGRLEFKEAHYTDANTGQECSKPYCHILPKGLAILAKHFAAKKPPEVSGARLHS